MPRKKQTVDERPSFIEALKALSEAKGLTDEDVLHALEEATERAYVKELGGGDDAVVSCHIDPITGKVDLAQIKKVVAEVEDDYLEVGVDEVNEGLAEPKYKVGDDYAIPCDFENASKVMAKAVKNNFRSRLAEAERVALYRIYKDHIGEMMVGTVEKSDDKTTTISIGRTTIELTRKELIGDEYFRIGDQIKVYIQEVRPAAPIDGKPMRAPQIEATRSSEGFLKRLFEEEIHEIYDGTVVIKAIARKAGYRSKVAVSSNNEDVDATGACIGQGGSRIQKIVTQLGSNGHNKEKIDIINYSENPGLFVIEACRPDVVLGANVYPDDAEGPFAEVIVKDESLRKQKNGKDTNKQLAEKLTGYKIELIGESEAIAKKLQYVPTEEWVKRAEEEKKAKAQAELTKKMEEDMAKRREAAKEAEEKKTKALAEQEKAEQAKQAEPVKEPTPVKIETPKPAPKAAVAPSDFPSEAINPAEAALRAMQEGKKAEEEANEPKDVKTTTTLSDLEKELESAKEKKTKPVAKAKRPRKITEDEVKREAKSSPVVPTMPVYTDEELSEIEEEDGHVDDYDDSDEDIEEEFAEYDRYYDDDGK